MMKVISQKALPVSAGVMLLSHAHLAHAGTETALLDPSCLLSWGWSTVVSGCQAFVAALHSDVGWVTRGADPTPCPGFRPVDFAFLAVFALIAVAFMRFRHSIARRRLDLARQMVEQGMDPPDALLGIKHRRNDLRRGLFLICIGISLLLALSTGEEAEASPIGLIPAFIGLGYLLCHYLAKRDER